MRPLLRIACLAAVLGLTVAANASPPHAWRAPPGHEPEPIWPDGAPQAKPAALAETTGTSLASTGQRWTWVTRVSVPAITVFAPEHPNGAAILVFPGGGYQALAVDLEGTEICDWLVSRGITAILVEYRVPNDGPHWSEAAGFDLDTHSSKPLEDAQRAISLVRSRAAEWHVDPHKIGVIGFSAGGHLVAAVSTRFGHRAYARLDAVDSVSCRPDFAIAAYPGHLFDRAHARLYADLPVTHGTPPTFLVHARNDPVDPPRHSRVYAAALRRAGVPVEMHLFTKGGHAFGLRRTDLPIGAWPTLAEAWLRKLRMVP
jgi:acetyl esterase/lipase